MKKYLNSPTKKNSFPDFLYIMAPSYTGSTLLTYLLAMHPDIATIGELKASAMGNIDTYTCSCGVLIRECDFWQKVSAEMMQRGRIFSLDDFGTQFRAKKYLCDRIIRAGIKGQFWEIVRTTGFTVFPRCRQALREIIEQNRNLIETILDLQNATVFLDGSKNPNRVRYFYNSGLWNLRVVYLIRDGRGQVNSYMKHNNTGVEEAAKEWVSIHRECDLMEKLLGKNCLRVYYEKLCQSPEEELRRIFTFINLDADSISTDFRSVEHHILGNAMRMASTSEIRLDERWKESLTKDDLASFYRIAGSLNRSYGYLQE